jgi:hypothetical protein
MYTIQQSKKVSAKTCEVKIMHTKKKKKTKSFGWFLTCRHARSEAPDYKLQTTNTKKRSKNVGVKAT